MYRVDATIVALTTGPAVDKRPYQRELHQPGSHDQPVDTEAYPELWNVPRWVSACQFANACGLDVPGTVVLAVVVVGQERFP